MTIKQNGGVFGRNPTFNDVTIDGTLTFDGDIDINSDLKIDGDLEVTGTSKLTGNVGIGKSSGSNALELQGEALFGSGTDGIKLTYSGGSSTGIIDTGYTSTGIEFRVGNVKKLVLNSSGNLEMNSGSGIDFSATAGTGTSELFDDYEEGVFSPVVAGTSTAGTYSYATQVGTYTKIGDSVRASISLEDITADSAGAGTLKITGLPFSADGTHISTVYARSLNFDNTAAYLIGYTSGTDIFIREIIDNSNGAGVNVADISSGNTRLYFSFFYKV